MLRRSILARSIAILLGSTAEVASVRTEILHPEVVLCKWPAVSLVLVMRALRMGVEVVATQALYLKMLFVGHAAWKHDGQNALTLGKGH
jgi:hypothetical protein